VDPGNTPQGKSFQASYARKLGRQEHCGGSSCAPIKTKSGLAH
jgi:hypothetical protein